MILNNLFLKKLIFNQKIYKNQLLPGLLKRTSHRDMKIPDFSKDMQDSVVDPKTKVTESEDTRRLRPYINSAVYMMIMLYGTKAEIVRYVKFMDASADVLALAKIEINLDEIAENRNVTFKWRGKPLMVWHRTDADIEAVRKIPLNILRDPEKDEDRVIDPKWLVVMGICTHLGCVPVSHQGDYGGYYCPCHGSHFDISGRTRKGPAPTNMEIPYYTISGNILSVG
ncbi:unnamed protein product [Ceutorhynchus assimilis]|uniref:Cytochrome b-c1 complex subunit Rieske, mitochondrial n=1 Tax=Ceutorhynchus assimilis TaxID=467358 RepID=A0A9N9QLV4_9CUCU|nr:unnamed protein product [Ceutorhynchus assimilis]